VAVTLSSIRQLPGIIEVTGDLFSATLVVKFDPSLVTPEQIVQKIKDTGYEVAGSFQP
jgi:copper chaperone CopZ